MAHNIEYAHYEENVNKMEVQAEWDDYVSREDWQEGCSGLPNKIRWINHVCDSNEQAEEYIRNHDKGWYDQLAVKYRTTVTPTTQTYKKLVARRQEISNTLNEREHKIHYSAENTKSEYVACKCCGSRLATKYIRSNTCPLCKADLRPASALNAIETSKKMLRGIDKKIKELEIKASKKAKIAWLVKIEYHT